MSIDRSKQRRKPHGYSEDEIWDMIEQVAIKTYGATGDFPIKKYAAGGRGISFDIKPDSGPISKGKNKGKCTIYENFNSQTGEYDVAGRLMCYTKGEVKISVEELCKSTNSPFPKDGQIKKRTPEEIEEIKRKNEESQKRRDAEALKAYRKVALEHAVGAFVSQMEYSRAKQHSIDLQNPIYRNEIYQKVKFVNAHPYTQKKLMNNPEKALIIHPKEPNLREMKDFIETKFVHPVLPNPMTGDQFKFSSKEILNSIESISDYIKPQNRTDGVMVLPLSHAGDNTMLNLQMILLKPNSEGKDKFFISGALKKTASLTFNEESLNENTQHIFVTEGYATAESLRQSMNDPTKPIIVGWDKDNIKNVMSIIAEKCPNANLMFVSDNDFKNYYKATQRLDKSPNAMVDNPGLKAVIEYAATAPDSVRQRLGILSPRIDFKDPNNKDITDFNDIHLRDGIVESRRILIDEMKQLIDRRKSNVCEASYWKGYYNDQVTFFQNELNEPRIKSLETDIVKVSESKPIETPAPQKMAEVEKDLSAKAESAPVEVKQPTPVAPVVEMPSNSPINRRECNNALDLIKGITDDHLQKIKPKSILQSGVIEDAPKPAVKRNTYYNRNTQSAPQAKAENAPVKDAPVPAKSEAAPSKSEPSAVANKGPVASAPAQEAKTAPVADTKTPTGSSAESQVANVNNVYVNTTSVQVKNAPADQPIVDPSIMTKLLVRSIEMQRALQTIEALRQCEIPLDDKEEALSIASGQTYTKAQDLVMAALDPVMGPHIKEKLRDALETSQNLPVFKELKEVDNLFSVHTAVLAKEEFDSIRLNQRLLSNAIGSFDNKEAALSGINDAVIESSALRFDRREKGVMYRSIVENFASIKDDSDWVKDVIKEFNKVKTAIEENNNDNSVGHSSVSKQENRSNHSNQPSI